MELNTLQNYCCMPYCGFQYIELQGVYWNELIELVQL